LGSNRSIRRDWQSTAPDPESFQFLTLCPEEAINPNGIGIGAFIFEPTPFLIKGVMLTN
jgi:hypothetical protein